MATDPLAPELDAALLAEYRVHGRLAVRRVIADLLAASAPARVHPVNETGRPELALDGTMHARDAEAARRGDEPAIRFDSDGIAAVPPAAGSVLLCVALDRHVKVQFHARLRLAGSHEWWLADVNQMVRIQRRAAYRIHPDATLRAIARVRSRDGTAIDVPIVDISVTGVTLACRGNHTDYAAGEMLPHSVLLLGPHSAAIPCTLIITQIRGKRVPADDQAVEVGARFAAMPEEVERLLARTLLALERAAIRHSCS